MILPGFNVSFSKRILKNRYEKFAAALEAFAVANLIIWIGNIIYTINSNQTLLNLTLIDIDLGIILMYSGFIGILNNPQMLAFAALGWIVAGIRVRRRYFRQSTSILIMSLIIPISLFPILLVIFAINLAISSIGPLILTLVLTFALLLIIFNLVGLLITIPAFIVMEMVKDPKPMEATVNVSQNSLILSGPIPPNPGEPIMYCIYRMKDKPGCAFLGYQVGNYPLICDYQSTWRACKLYSHLYYRLVVLENEK